MKKYSFKDLTKEVLRIAKEPLTADGVWKKAKEYGIDSKINSSGKTPWQTISALIYIDIRDNPQSEFIQTSKNPPMFSLKQLKTSTNSVTGINPVDSEDNAKFHERDLHPLLSTYVNSNPHFKCYTKTIYHEKTKREAAGKNKWLHPDIVGIYFPFDDYSDTTIQMINSFGDNVIKLFSFEMKISIDIQHLREYYFQAVSNSSWANEGYLVALDYSNDSSFTDEMRRLNNSFGIGFIKLDSEHVEQSEIVLPAKYNTEIDWDTVNRLVEDNSDFKQFFDSINEDNQLKKVKSKYDRVYDTAEMQAYIKKHNIRGN